MAASHIILKSDNYFTATFSLAPPALTDNSLAEWSPIHHAKSEKVIRRQVPALKACVLPSSEILSLWRPQNCYSQS